MDIPWKELESHTFDALLEEIVSRDGTDYGETETSIMVKVSQLKRQIEKGEAVLYWDTNTESASILSRQSRSLDVKNDEEWSP
ncbi:MAG: YheU family protein [Gammaproteobacteria bacterium]|nr:YheU family protein [Gammaproteobacteria bacterium]